MHLAVLGSLESWYAADLRRAASGEHTITPLTFRQLTASVQPGGQAMIAGGFDLRQADALLVRTMPPGSLEQVVFRMDVLGRLESEGHLVINPPRAVEAAVDKYLATARLQAAGLPVPRTFACQTVGDAMQAMTDLGGDVVVKPLFGSEGRGITRLNDEAVALRVFQTLVQLQAVLYVQEFIPHEGCDLRLLVIGNEILAMRRRNPADWRTNVARGATAEPFTPNAAMCGMAMAAAACLGAPLAGVDILPGRDGRLYLIEVNAVPGWKALAATLGVDVSRRVLDYIAGRISH